MWQCVKCRENVEDSFEVCWSCGTSRNGIEDPSFVKVEEASAAAAPTVADDGATQAPAAPPVEKPPLFCPRCDRELDYVGTKSFHEGTRLGALGDLGELFINKEHFDVYCCPRCGRVEFFIDGIGEEFRPH